MIGRVKELAELDAFYESHEIHVLALYGRSGIGKRTLLKEFVRGKQSIFFNAYQTTEETELRLLAKAMGLKAEGRPLTLEGLLDQVSKVASGGKLVFIIMGFHAFVKSGNAFSQILHSYFSEKWKNGSVKLVLCESAYLHMEKEILGKKSLWKDAAVAKMELKPLDYYDAFQFYPEMSALEASQLYGITGGVPHYLKRIEAQDTWESAVKRIFLAPDLESMLMPEKWIGDELREMSYYNRLMMALAGGKSRVNEISQEIGKPKDVVVPYLNTLMSIGTVTKENPLTEPTNRRKTRYSIVNICDRFWYQCVAPDIDLYYEGKADKLLEEKIRPKMDAFMRPVFVRMCRAYLTRMNDRKALPFTVEKVGNWWENDEESKTSEGFDFVAMGEAEGRNSMVYARCNYGDEIIGMPELKALIDLTKKMKDRGPAFYMYFSKAGFAENAITVAATIKNILLISLEDLFRI